VGHSRDRKRLMALNVARLNMGGAGAVCKGPDGPASMELVQKPCRPSYGIDTGYRLDSVGRPNHFAWGGGVTAEVDTRTAAFKARRPVTLAQACEMI